MLGVRNVSMVWRSGGLRARAAEMCILNMVVNAMKSAWLIVVAVLAVGSVRAQETLFGGDVAVGGFGGPFLQATAINNQFGLLVGGGGGVIIGHTIMLGGAGYGGVNNDSEEEAPSGRPYLNVGYGGGVLQYIHRSDDLVHFNLGVLVGAGGVGYRAQSGDDGYSGNGRDTLSDAFFVVEPALDAELNVTRNFRICIGAGYRMVSGIQLRGLSNSDIGGPSARLLLKFGSF